MQGTIKTLTDKNFGFISVEGGDDVFFHANNLVGVDFASLKQGDAVSFDTESTPKGKAAVNVQRA